VSALSKIVKPIHHYGLQFTPRIAGQWRVEHRDLDTDSILFQGENQGAFVSVQ
jgi:hypothetical protein